MIAEINASFPRCSDKRSSRYVGRLFASDDVETCLHCSNALGTFGLWPVSEKQLSRVSRAAKLKEKGSSLRQSL